MLKKTKSIIAMLLALVMLLSACGPKPDSETTESSTEATDATDAASDSVSESVSESASATETASESGDSTETESETEEDTEISLEGDFGSSILYADAIKNGVQSYYPDGAARANYRIENLNIEAEFALKSGKDPQLTYLKNKHGGTYLENTMDVFVRMTDGKTYYATDSSQNAHVNIYRIGYYYYDVRILGQSFYSSAKIEKTLDLNESLFDFGSADTKGLTVTDGVIKYTANGGIDPYIRCEKNDISFSLSEYNAISFSAKSSYASAAQIWVITDKNQSYNEGSTGYYTIHNDGEWHDYTVMLNEIPGIDGETVIGFRIDLGIKPGEVIEIKELEALKVDSSAPYVLLDRTWHTYPDKVHQELHFVAPLGQENIDAVGMITNIPAEKVAKVVVKDGKALHDSLENIDWSSAEYVGFDIKDVGIFGYIMPYDGKGGSIEVTLKDNVYTIIQETVPDGNEILASQAVNNTSNDLFMGQRVYTDETHEFTDFLREAEWERHPIKGIKSDNYVGYDSLNGAYNFTIGGTSFNHAYYSAWNTHFSTKAIIKNLDDDRKIYVRTSTTSGNLENAVLLDGDGLIIPIPLEVSKNFGGEKEEYVMSRGDTSYGETLFPLVSEKNAQLSINLLNVYQNWGQFPIKQLSSIGYFAPYYHLSIGTTETSCISPWYVRGRTLWTLPDFRAVSAPLWNDQPQHTSAVTPQVLQYTDAKGNYVIGENIKNVITSSGPTYAEVKMDYITDDGKMAVSYNHLEMPHTDELRACYEVRIDILGDVSFKDFKKDFSFYRLFPSGIPYKMSFLDENNEIKVAGIKTNDARDTFILGTESPHFGIYEMHTWNGSLSSNCVNIGFVICDSDITVGGEKFNGNFAVIEEKTNNYRLSLNLDEVTFKAGDHINFDIILSPWGSHLSTDASNLTNMRENSALNPYKVEAIDGETIESTYLPKVRSTNGKSAEFTISGGANNAALRVYGFNKLTAPKIYEKVNGEWVEYTVSSINTPDNTKSKNYYDGYFTYYDGDGTYSYSFVVNMDNVESRTFKVVADHDFEPWPEVIIENDDPINLYVDPVELGNLMASKIPGIGSATVSDKLEYIRIAGDSGKNSEVSLQVYSAVEPLATGQYIVLKYRMPSTNKENNTFEFFASTINNSASGTDSIHMMASGTHYKNDQWNLLVIDVPSIRPATFIADSEGNYYCNYIRFDIFNTVMSTESYVDIAYVGMCDSLEKIRELNSDMETLVLYNKSGAATMNVKTGEFVKPSGGSSSNPSQPVSDGVTVSKNGASLIAADNAQGYTLSNVAYLTKVDSINGYGPNKAIGTAYNFRGSDSATGVATFNFDGDTTEDLALVITGWGLYYGGVEKYVWSADGGKTWNDVKLRNKSSLGNATSTMVGFANNICGKTDFDKYTANSAYQGPTQGPDRAAGLSADLSAYEGQTVNVTFAAVPAADNDTLCIIAHITNVKVKKISVDESDNPYNDPVNFLFTATEIYDKFGGKDLPGVGTLTLSEKSDYVTFTGSGDNASEAVLNVFKNPESVATGQYIILKYRLSSTNEKSDYFHFYTSTVNKNVTGTDYAQYWISQTELDDQWHVIVIDASSYIPGNFAAVDGKYYATHLRFDVFNSQRSAGDKVDIAYVGLSDSIDDICALNADMATLKLCTKDATTNSNKVQYINVETKEITDTIQ